MKKNILSVIGAATVAAVALKLTTKYVKNEVIKELEDDGYLYDDDDCDDCDECCGCDERIDDIHHAPVAAVHVIRVERKHDETKKDVRNKILFTILCLLIYRLGCGITIPFVNTAALQTMFGSTSVLDYYNLVSGGALSQCAVFAIGVSAYINASIIIQLLTVAIPKLEEISKDIGGQKQINKITQYVGCGLAAVTAIGYFFIMKNYGAMKYTSGISQVVEAITVIAILTAGSQIVIWLGWLIDEKGIGNGISLIIFTGIISRWDAVISLFQNSIAMGKENGWWYYLMIPGVILFVLAATFYVVFASDAERRVPVQYAGKNVGNKASTGQSSYIPIKLIMSGVMPIIFSSTICSMPSLVTMFLDYNKHPSLYMALASWNSRNWIYDVAYVALIFAFNLFYIRHF